MVWVGDSLLGFEASLCFCLSTGGGSVFRFVCWSMGLFFGIVIGPLVAF